MIDRSWMVDDDPASTLWSQPGSVEFLAQEMPEEIPVEVPTQVALPQIAVGNHGGLHGFT